jgi:hypothetical protein
MLSRVELVIKVAAISLSVRISFSCTPALIPKEFQPKAFIKTLSSYLFSDYLELTLGLSD